MGDDENQPLPVAAVGLPRSRRRARLKIGRLEFERALFRVTELQRSLPDLVWMPGPEPGSPET